MNQAQTHQSGQSAGRDDGTDFVCDNCGCEIMIKHAGDASKHSSDTYTCRCGRPMRLEHSDR